MNATFEFKPEATEADFAHMHAAAAVASEESSKAFFTPEFGNSCKTALKVGIGIGCFVGGYMIVTGTASYVVNKVFGKDE